jgi:formate-dependent phosphoribosylglycinamide formyltransferase (GAR transformylase)
MNRKQSVNWPHTELGLKTADYRYAKTFEEFSASGRR